LFLEKLAWKLNVSEAGSIPFNSTSATDQSGKWVVEIVSID
jgi:hypothetical protein